jgi:hypothetical protein
MTKIRGLRYQNSQRKISKLISCQYLMKVLALILYFYELQQVNNSSQNLLQ